MLVQSLSVHCCLFLKERSISVLWRWESHNTKSLVCPQQRFWYCILSVLFSLLQYPESTLEVETKQVMMHNVSSLPLTVVLKATYPFQLLVEDPRWAPVNVKSSQSVSSLCHRIDTKTAYRMAWNVCDFLQFLSRSTEKNVPRKKSFPVKTFSTIIYSNNNIIVSMVSWRKGSATLQM